MSEFSFDASKYPLPGASNIIPLHGDTNPGSQSPSQGVQPIGATAAPQLPHLGELPDEFKGPDGYPVAPLNWGGPKKEPIYRNGEHHTHPFPIPWPPGNAGHIARSLFAGSYIPHQESAVIATLATLSAVAGRAYRTPSYATLAQYYLLIAGSGDGKEAIYNLVPMLLERWTDSTSIIERKKMYWRFMAQNTPKSGAALHVMALKKPGHLIMHPEFGKKLRIIASSGGKGSFDHGLGDMMIELFEKRVMQGIERAKDEDCHDSVDWPAISFIGESTPATFYNALTDDMMEDGFFSRFLTMEVTTLRPPGNENHGKIDLEREPLDAFRALCMYSFDINEAGFLEPNHVRYDNHTTEQLMNDHEELCRREQNRAKRNKDIYAGAVWARAHLKVLKIASLLAVVDNPESPIMTSLHAEWAIGLIESDSNRFIVKVKSGDVGTGDNVREKKVWEICKKVITGQIKDVDPAIARQGVVTRRVLQNNTSRLAPFSKHPLGGAKALDGAIEAMIKNGVLYKLTTQNKSDRNMKIGYFGDCYQISHNLDGTPEKEPPEEMESVTVESNATFAVPKGTARGTTIRFDVAEFEADMAKREALQDKWANRKPWETN